MRSYISTDPVVAMQLARARAQPAKGGESLPQRGEAATGALALPILVDSGTFQMHLYWVMTDHWYTHAILHTNFYILIPIHFCKRLQTFANEFKRV